jgi:hypothetical protein
MVDRAERLQVMLTEDELVALDDWRFSRRMPSRAAAIRELLKRGLAAEGWDSAAGRGSSTEFGVIRNPAGSSQAPPIEKSSVKRSGK